MQTLPSTKYRFLAQLCEALECYLEHSDWAIIDNNSCLEISQSDLDTMRETPGWSEIEAKLEQYNVHLSIYDRANLDGWLDQILSIIP